MRSSKLIEYFVQHKDPIVYDEIRQKAEDFNDQDLKEVEKITAQLNAAIIIPSSIENKIIAFFVLGRKRSGKLYSQDDLAVLYLYRTRGYSTDYFFTDLILRQVLGSLIDSRR